MISNPDAIMDEFAAAGSDSFIVHYEGNNNLHRTIQKAKQLKTKIGVAINPATPTCALDAILSEIDLVLVMTVNPGYGNQHFLSFTLDKIKKVRQMITDKKLNCEIEVDGGIIPETATQAAQVGATVFVAGTSVFKSPLDIPAAMEALRSA